MRIDQEIDSALRMLSEAQAPKDLTACVHRSLRTAAANQHERKAFRLWVPITCAAAAILFAAMLPMYFTPGKRENIARTKTPTVDSAASKPHPPARVLANSARPQSVSTAIAQRNSPTRKRAAYRHVAYLMSYPLTRQEKLLVVFARTAKPEELRDLNPEYQAKVEAQQEAEFAAYLKSGNNSNTQETSETAQTNQSTQE